METTSVAATGWSGINPWSSGGSGSAGAGDFFAQLLALSGANLTPGQSVQGSPLAMSNGLLDGQQLTPEQMQQLQDALQAQGVMTPGFYPWMASASSPVSGLPSWAVNINNLMQQTTMLRGLPGLAQTPNSQGGVALPSTGPLTPSLLAARGQSPVTGDIPVPGQNLDTLGQSLSAQQGVVVDEQASAASISLVDSSESQDAAATVLAMPLPDAAKTGENAPGLVTSASNMKLSSSAIHHGAAQAHMNRTGEGVEQSMTASAEQQQDLPHAQALSGQAQDSASPETLVWQSTRVQVQRSSSDANTTTQMTAEVKAAALEGKLNEAAMHQQHQQQQHAQQQGTMTEEKMAAADSLQAQESGENQAFAETLEGVSAERSSNGVNAKGLFVLASPLRSPQWSAEFGQKMTMMVNQRLGTASIRLNPEHLGPIGVTLRFDEQNNLTLAFKGSEMAQDAIRQALPQLKEMLEAQGVRLDSAAFEQPSETHNSFGQNADNPQQNASKDHQAWLESEDQNQVADTQQDWQNVDLNQRMHILA